MADWLLLIGAATSAWLASAWLALAMPEHWKRVFDSGSPSKSKVLVLRLLASAGLIGSATLCFLADRPSMAVLVWLMLLSLSASLTAFTLAWKPGLMKPVFPGRTRA